jgi:hypothetical protein
MLHRRQADREKEEMSAPVEKWLIIIWDTVAKAWVIAESHPHSQEEQAKGQLAHYRQTAVAVRLIHTADGA